MKSGIIYITASGDGNVAAECAIHQTQGWIVPLSKHCAYITRELQEIFDNEVQS